MRVSLGPHPVSGRSEYRSITVHGDLAAAEAARNRWAAKATLVRSRGEARPAIVVGDLLGEWFDTDHGWRPSTISGYKSVVRFLTSDPVALRRAVDLTPRTMAAAQTAWRTTGWRDPTVWARTRVLRSAMGWAYAERIIDLNPLDGMAPPPQAGVRLHASIDDVRAILDHAQRQVDLARRGDRGSSPQSHRAEQVLLLARLAADSGARRGELAALQLGDLDGDVLTISRGVSNEVLGPTKSRRIRRVTLGATAANLWRESVERWRSQTSTPFGPWLFSAAPDHSRRLTTSTLGHWFAALALDAGHPDVTLHRIRHTVATTLVSQGHLLQAQYRLGHRDASTTLRVYSHVLPLTDQDTAATLDRLYRPNTPPDRPGHRR